MTKNFGGRQLELPFDDFIGELRKGLPDLTARIRDEAERLAQTNLTVPTGAMTDTVMAANRKANERELQVLAAQSGQIKTGAISRRKLLQTWLPLAVTAAAGGGAIGATYHAGKYFQDRQRDIDAWKLHPNMIIDIAHRHAKRNALREMQKTIQGSFPNEAFLIKAIFDHGSNFDEVHQNLARLNKLLQHGSTDADVIAFVGRKYASDHRYLGLTKQARDIMATVDLSKTTDLCLRFMTIECGTDVCCPCLSQIRL